MVVWLQYSKESFDNLAVIRTIMKEFPCDYLKAGFQKRYLGNDYEWV